MATVSTYRAVAFICELKILHATSILPFRPYLLYPVSFIKLRFALKLSMRATPVHTPNETLTVKTGLAIVQAR